MIAQYGDTIGVSLHSALSVLAPWTAAYGHSDCPQTISHWTIAHCCNKPEIDRNRQVRLSPLDLIGSIRHGILDHAATQSHVKTVDMGYRNLQEANPCWSGCIDVLCCPVGIYHACHAPIVVSDATSNPILRRVMLVHLQPSTPWAQPSQTLRVRRPVKCQSHLGGVIDSDHV